MIVAPIIKNLLYPTLLTIIPKGPLKKAVAMYVTVMTCPADDCV